MEQRSIGSLEVSLVGLGCNQFGRKIDAEQSAAVVNAAIDSGVTFFDTSDRYGYGDRPHSGEGRSEEFLGRAIGSRRASVVIATKFGNQLEGDPKKRGGSRRWVLEACEGSLRRLGTDYIDLYQIHRPDAQTPIEETLGALSELKQQGKVREIGCSNFTVEQFDDAMSASEQHGHASFQSIQNEYSLLYREPEKGVLQACEKHGTAFLPYFPLASGLLTGKYVKDNPTPQDARLAQFPPNRPHLGLTDENLDRVARLSQFAADRGHELLELAFAWLAARPAVASVIAGATRPDQVVTNTRAVDWKLSDDDLAVIDEL